MNPKPVRTAGNSAFANPPDNIRCGKSGMSANSISDGLLRFLHLYFTRRTGFSFVRVALALYGQWHSLSDPELEHSLITRIDFNLFCRFDEQCAIKFFVSDFLGTKSLVAVQTSVRPPGFCIACLTSRFVILFYTCLFGNMRFLLYLRADFLIVFLLSFSA